MNDIGKIIGYILLAVVLVGLVLVLLINGHQEPSIFIVPDETVPEKVQ